MINLQICNLDWEETFFGFNPTGHGGSDGLHAYVPSLDYAVTDLVCRSLCLSGFSLQSILLLKTNSHLSHLQKSFLEKVFTENPGLPCFCFGHSTGGAIILKVTSLDPLNNIIVSSDNYTNLNSVKNNSSAGYAGSKDWISSFRHCIDFTSCWSPTIPSNLRCKLIRKVKS